MSHLTVFHFPPPPLVCEALYAEGALPERGHLPEPGAAGGAAGAGGEVPPVRGGAGALLRHVWGVHRGQGPKAAGVTLFPHLPSQVGTVLHVRSRVAAVGLTCSLTPILSSFQVSADERDKRLPQVFQVLGEARLRVTPADPQTWSFCRCPPPPPH